MSSESEAHLLPEHVVGRSSHAELRLEFPFISGQHSVIRWNGLRWEVRDLASRNGTWVNGVRLAPGKPAPVAEGDVVRFGDVSQEWRLEDDSSPGTMVVGLGGGPPLVTHGGVLAIPSADDPEAMVFCDATGIWQLERADVALMPLRDGQTFEAAGRTWRFHCPAVVPRTAAPNEARDVGGLRLKLRVSRDEEHVEITVECAGKTFDLGSRGHNYLLLTLARERLKDVAAGMPDPSSGWMYQDMLLNALTMPATQLNIDVFRIRKQFAALDLTDPANVIERRPRTKQIRIGVPRVEILTI